MTDNTEDRTEGVDLQELDELVRLLDGFAQSDTSRMKLGVSEELGAGQVQKQYHHGRCDVGSPWACGTAFDVIE